MKNGMKKAFQELALTIAHYEIATGLDKAHCTSHFSLCHLDLATHMTPSGSALMVVSGGDTGWQWV